LAKLVLSLSGNVLNQYFTDKPVISIGRDSDADIAINDALLSREHARITTVGEDHIIEDLQSSNGTLVNGARTTRKILQHRDIIGLGNHTLRYLNTRIAGEVDLERTMVIQPLLYDGQATDGNPLAAMPAIRTVKASLPNANIKVLAAEAGEYEAGASVQLDRVVTTFGIPGERLIVITRRPQGYFLTHVEGQNLPRLNGKTISADAHPLQNGDTIEAAGYRLEFLDSSPA
jgi:pSer/pThr/pTyr-binding forkhead associated (FHA) protein